MHVLEYLSDPECSRKPKESLTSEYRLLCSGTVYRGSGGDPLKSEVSRILLDPPLTLFAASRPLDYYPLELVLELTVPMVREENPAGAYSFHPDDEVATDLAALLSLLCRRLITVAGKVSERQADYAHPLYGCRPCPMPVVTSMRAVCWRRHPLVACTSLEGEKYLDYNPRPKAVDPRRLTALLLGLPGIEHAPGIVASCRLYALALELLQERPDISYQLLISGAETMANAVLASYQPPTGDKVEKKRGVVSLAQRLGLPEEQAEDLAVEACKDDHWIGRKFRKFLMDNVADSVWTEPDDLFHEMPGGILPKREGLAKTLSTVYDARSKATHVGWPFPVAASYTGGPTIPTRVAANLLLNREPPFPPVVWFERIVNSALCGFWEHALRATQT